MNSEEKELQQPKINVFISVPMHDRTKQQIEDELTSHINKVYDYFNCETEEDKMEILNMLNAYNLTKDFPSAKEYFEAQNMNTSAKEEYKNSLSSSIATTMSTTAVGAARRSSCPVVTT